MKLCLPFIVLFLSLSVFGESTKIIRLDENSLTDFEFIPSATQHEYLGVYYNANVDLHVWYNDFSNPIVLGGFVDRSREATKRHDKREDAVKEAKKRIDTTGWDWSLDQALKIQHGDQFTEDQETYKKVIVVYLKHDSDNKTTPRKVRSWKIEKVLAEEP